MPPTDSRPIAGVSIIAGRHAAASPAPDARFHGVEAATGAPLAITFVAASPQDVSAACEAGRGAESILRDSSPDRRAALLRGIADGIAALGDSLVETVCLETGLGSDRIRGERDRTVFQLRTFADLAVRGDWVDAVIDRGNPTRTPLPKPDVRRMLRPLGLCAVFPASNFPLAFGVAGGDTASAVAAGCPVVVKGHPAHPATGEMVATVVAAAVAGTGLPGGTFSFLHAGGVRDITVGEELVRHPHVRAVGFTGSKGGGLSLARLAASRDEPIPVFAEMGSVNPTFLLPDAVAADAEGLATKLAGAIVGSVGQLCTKPGLLFVVASKPAEAFLFALAGRLAAASPAPMLTSRTLANFAARLRSQATIEGVSTVGGVAEPASSPGSKVLPVLLRVSADVFARNPTLAEECFGPSAIAVVCTSPEQMQALAATLPGSLAAAVFAADSDSKHATILADVVASRVGRVVFGGVTTGVEVCAAMQHGGPFPATTRPETTSVGSAAIRRWCRPIAWQNAPDGFLPPALRDANPLNIARTVDGLLVPAGMAPS